MSGLVGSGRSELLETIFGLHAADSGEVFIGESRLPGGRVLDAIRAGVALVPEDRQRQGLLFSLVLRHNLVLARAAADQRFWCGGPTSARSAPVLSGLAHQGARDRGADRLSGGKS